MQFCRWRARSGSAVVAIVNTHWHLDHVSGNPALRKAYPGLRVYASNAIDGALAGFFPASAKESAGYLDDPQVPQATRDDIRGDLQTIANGAALKPDEVIAAAGNRTLGGRTLRLNLAPDAATAGDVWIVDEQSRVVVLGDLVTLPAPFLDTACPEGWQERIAAGGRHAFRDSDSRSWRADDPCRVSAVPGRVRRVHRLLELGANRGRLRIGLVGLDRRPAGRRPARAATGAGHGGVLRRHAQGQRRAQQVLRVGRRCRRRCR